MNARRVGLLAAATVLAGGLALRAAAPAPATKDASPDLGPTVVVLKELQKEYEPVPFDHAGHAKMAQMSGGCVTCHHRPPQQAATAPADSRARLKGQDSAADIPACKSCHPPSDENTDLRRPGLKGAYHRQCLNCHRDWMHANACTVCHKPKGAPASRPGGASRDDILGRMHPPIPEPTLKLYKARYLPADGPNVLFRHKEHSTGYGIPCARCHRDNACANCHDPQAGATVSKPIRADKTWVDWHEPCISCHQQYRCRHCHYKDDQPPPPAFAHRQTGQILDANHNTLRCTQCHPNVQTTARPTCGSGPCHKANPAVSFPAHRPGPVTSKPATPADEPPATRPADKATLQRIRR